MSQNIFDNEIFFEKYKELRMKEYNYNSLVEQPAIKSMLPNVKNKVILDLGCGYGKNCMEFIECGARKVTGIDISEKMLEIANKENADDNIDYYKMDMNEINTVKNEFDIVFSSLAFHYIKDFEKLLADISGLLKNNGILLFSQEHPYTTAPKCGPSWTKDSNGKKIHYNLSDYMYSGERKTKWFVDNIEKYHRPVSEIVNSLIGAGYIIEKILEPVPDRFALDKMPDLYDEFEKTTSIIIRARKY